jgi:aryl-alcohol dehydrogenase-like predicted oxidoreductase
MTELRKIRLPRTDLVVSELCLGTNQYGTAQDLAKASAILATFTQAGGNFLDTARAYGDWVPTVPRAASETVIGQWLRGRRRSDVVIATKGCEFDYRAALTFRMTPEHLESDLSGSLASLQTDYIDLYWLHRDDPSQPVAPIIDALIAHQKAGRIRYFGCSNWAPARIREAQAHAASRGHDGFVACQPMWGLAATDPQAVAQWSGGQVYGEELKALHAAGLTMIPYSSQCMGFFSKYAAKGKAGLNDLLTKLYLSDANLRRLEVAQTLAQRHGVTLAQIVLAYLVRQPLTTIPIIGCSGIAQLEESLGATAVALTPADLAALAAG